MMIKNLVSTSTLLLAALAMVITTSCSKQSGISGEINGASGKTLYLDSFSATGSSVVLDSAQLGETGTFHFSPKKGLAMDLYRLRLDKDAMLIMTDSTESLVVKANADSLASPLYVGGSVQSELLHELKETVEDYNRQLIALKKGPQAGATSEDKLAMNKKAIEIQDSRREYIVTFLEEHKQDAVSLAAVTLLNINSDMAEYVKVRDRVKDIHGDSYYFNMLTQQIDAAKKQKVQRQGGNTAQQAKNNKYSVGMEAPDIVMADLKGKTRKLSDLKGKVVLIDFWASWCGPCRRENPNVVRAYQEYRDKGFEVFSVSLDRQQDRWEKAVEQDNLIWPNHVCDMKGWKNEASDLYGISSIPHTVLVGRDGKIVATKLRGAALDAKLAELFQG